jgi:hypothetical protein
MTTIEANKGRAAVGLWATIAATRYRDSTRPADHSCVHRTRQGDLTRRQALQDYHVDRSDNATGPHRLVATSEPRGPSGSDHVEQGLSTATSAAPSALVAALS